MLVPATGQDDLGQNAKAAITFLRYTLALRYRREEEIPSGERLEITKEDLRHIKVGDAIKHLPFPHQPAWRASVVEGRRSAAFLSTEEEKDGKDRRITLHLDGRSGRPRPYLASSLPRTVLSSANAVESPTALLARREMQSWRLLQLEPSALRNSDSFSAPVHIGVDGSHLASTLHHLARREAGNGEPRGRDSSVFVRVANQLSALIEDIREVCVDEDPQRELLTLQVMDRDRNLHAARALSDGTLRFLALAILELDPDAQGLLCFEEPENGVHPERISSMLKLLKDLSVDTEEPIGPDNSLRQVIVNTHSPAVVGFVDHDDLLVAEPREAKVNGKPCRAVGFSWLSDTWRHRAFPNDRTVSRGTLGPYLNPLAFAEALEEPSDGVRTSRSAKRRRVKDRDDLRPLFALLKDE
jgi:hypothetical protein